ncbi:hypothetical protein VNO77_35037 [Canavalia gladiata]|uniref:Uncharacterized protein n=1 Tax=Canavalia gladiata TaxID=3824 RepID=A0AAN9PZI4_CANGL
MGVGELGVSGIPCIACNSRVPKRGWIIAKRKAWRSGITSDAACATQHHKLNHKLGLVVRGVAHNPQDQGSNPLEAIPPFFGKYRSCKLSG